MALTIFEFFETATTLPPDSMLMVNTPARVLAKMTPSAEPRRRGIPGIEARSRTLYRTHAQAPPALQET
jgi:hypothetical protein